MGQYNEALAIYQEVLPVFREFKDRNHIGEYLTLLGELAFLAGDLHGARRWITEGLEMCRRFNIHLRYFQALAILNMVLNLEGQYSLVVRRSQAIPLYPNDPFNGFPRFR